MRFRVTTHATVQRVYLVDAESAKGAEQAIAGAVPVFEHTLEEKWATIMSDPLYLHPPRKLPKGGSES